MGINTLQLSKNDSKTICGYGKDPKTKRCKAFTYPKGFHVFAKKEDAQVVLNITKQDKPHLDFAIVPVYFYKKDIVAEGTEDYESEGKNTQSVLVVKSYIVREKDIKTSFPDEIF